MARNVRPYYRRGGVRVRGHRRLSTKQAFKLRDRMLKESGTFRHYKKEAYQMSKADKAERREEDIL